MSKKVMIDGVELIEGDLVVTTEFTEKYAKNDKVSCSSNDDMAVLLDIEVGEDQIAMRNIRELANVIQKARKAAKVNVEDAIEVFYDTDNEAMKKSICKYQEAIFKILKKPFVQREKYDGKRPVIADGKADIDGQIVNYWICMPSFSFNVGSIEVYS
jgi:hypothetical protein